MCKLTHFKKTIHTQLLTLMQSLCICLIARKFHPVCKQNNNEDTALLFFTRKLVYTLGYVKLYVRCRRTDAHTGIHTYAPLLSLCV